LYFRIAKTGKIAKFVFGRQKGFSENSLRKMSKPEIQNEFEKTEA
jgi:hypothetical protein